MINLAIVQKVLALQPGHPDLHATSARSSWQQLMCEAQALGWPDSEQSPAAVVAWLLQQPEHPLRAQLSELLASPPSWIELFPLLEPEPAPAAEPPALDPIQQAEAVRQEGLDNLSFGWLPLEGQFHQLIQAIREQGRQPWIVDAGSHSGRSARWLAERWPEAVVICLVQRAADEALVAHTTAGTRVMRLLSQPLAGAELALNTAHSTGLKMPLEWLHRWITAQNGEPVLLHLDTFSDGFADWFSLGGAWLQPFPVVLLHGALKLDEQGRRLPQVHQQALAAAGFELVRSATVIVAIQRHHLGAPSPITAAEAAALPLLNGTIIETGGVVAFDGEWQYPAITEQLACRLAMLRLPAASDLVYVGFPWASLIDHLNNGTLRGRALQQQLQQLVPRLEGRRRRITVCQHIFFQDYRWAFELAGITDVFWPHATIHNNLPWITLHPFPLFAVQWQDQSGAEKERDILYSFIGAQATRLYLSNSRDLILSNLADLPGSLIRCNASWFYDDLVYGVQIRGTIQPDDPRAQGSGPQEQRQRYIDSLQRSIFALCPSGTGPNTIRLWEALGYGAIPVVLSDTWKPPGPRQLWDAAIFVLPDTPEGVMSIPQLTAQWAADERLLLKKRQAMAELWHRYGPATFITDIEALWQQQTSPVERRSAMTQPPSPQTATRASTAAQVAKRIGPPVTLTAISGRLDRLPAVLDSLRAQTLRPAQVHLHLSHEPQLLDQGVDPNHPLVVGLGDDPMVQIHWVANLGPYRKIVPFLEAGGYNHCGDSYGSKQDDLFITVDDDTLYPPRFIEYLLRHYERHGCIVAHRGRRTRTAAIGGFVPYKDWHDDLREPRLANVATGQSGVLYRRSYFPDDLQLNAALTVAPTHDDLWLRWLTAQEGQPVVILQPNAAAKSKQLAFPSASPAPADEQQSLWLAYNAPEAPESGSGGTDAACKAIHTYFRARGFDLETLLRKEQEDQADFY